MATFGFLHTAKINLSLKVCYPLTLTQLPTNLDAISRLAWIEEEKKSVQDLSEWWTDIEHFLHVIHISMFK